MAFFEIDGGRLFYEIRGNSAPPLVFVHGLACAHEDWRNQVSCFSPSYRVVSLDQRGHGRSSGHASGFDIEHLAADLAALAEHLQLPPAVLVGHSFGCRVVLECARSAPRRVAGVVLVDGSRLASGNADAACRATLETIENIGYGAFFEKFFSQMFTAASDVATREKIVTRAGRLPRAVALELMPHMITWDCDRVESALGGLKVPLTVLQSTYINEQRQRVSLQPGESTPWTALVQALVPHAEVAVVPGIGHFSMLEAPAEVNRRIEALLQRLVAD
jgi:pimeloyl-ACP methyl ester carboxylesterase